MKKVYNLGTRLTYVDISRVSDCYLVCDGESELHLLLSVAEVI